MWFLFLGAVFEQGTTQTQTAFKYAVTVRNQPTEEKRIVDMEFQAFVNVINTADAFKLSRISEYIHISIKPFNILFNVLGHYGFMGIDGQTLPRQNT